MRVLLTVKIDSTLLVLAAELMLLVPEGCWWVNVRGPRQVSIEEVQVLLIGEVELGLLLLKVKAVLLALDMQLVLLEEQNT